MTDTPYVPPVIPIVIVRSPSGVPYIPADDVVRMLRAIAVAVRQNPDMPYYDVAAAIDGEADTLDCRAIGIAAGLE